MVGADPPPLLEVPVGVVAPADALSGGVDLSSAAFASAAATVIVEFAGSSDVPVAFSD